MTIIGVLVASLTWLFPRTGETVTPSSAPAPAPSPSATPTVKVTLSAPPTPAPAHTPSSSPSSSYQFVFSRKPLRVSWPACYTWVDLDVPRITDDNDVDDLEYANCGYGGDLNGGGEQFGEGPKAEPKAAEECVDSAQSLGIERVLVKDLRLSQTFCSVTSEGNVAWLRLVRITGDRDRPDLRFEMTFWRQGG
ncbi:hypothetical protein [Streptosporangium sp. KLBMP 9127]|nr:hypothetical protein [Streptosporangium sp. KLBMP 9127]